MIEEHTTIFFYVEKQLAPEGIFYPTLKVTGE
jgi:hypothetical protein